MRKTLRDFPLTRLGKIVTDDIRNANTDPADPKRHNLYDYYDTHLKEYYFQRNPGCFPLVISYYVDKVLHVPRHMCAELFQKEMEYWCIPFNLTDCCQGYHRHEWETTEGVRLTNQLLEKQTKHSTAASLMSIFSSSMVILSTIVLCISTHPDVRIMNSDGTISDHPRVKVFEIICIIWFTFEYVIRTATCPSYKKILYVDDEPHRSSCDPSVLYHNLRRNAQLERWVRFPICKANSTGAAYFPSDANIQSCTALRRIASSWLHSKEQSARARTSTYALIDGNDSLFISGVLCRNRKC